MTAIIGTDYLGSNFVSTSQYGATVENNSPAKNIYADHCEYITGKDYIGSNFVTKAPSTPSNSDSVLGKDYLGSTFVSYAQPNTFDDELKSVANGIVKDCIAKATDKMSQENALEPEEDIELDILGNGLLKKKIVRKGDGLPFRAERGQEITIKLETFLKNGDMVESNDEMKFILADRDVPDAIDLAVNLMELNESAIITTDAKYAYGADGNKNDPCVPPNSDLVFHITVLKIEDGPYNTSVDINRRLAWADRKREAGNTLYSNKNYREAVQIYSKCAKVLEQAIEQQHDQNIENEIKSLAIKCCNNLIAANMKIEMWQDALIACKTVIALDPNNTKALFRKGKVLSEMGDLKKAVEALQAALKTDSLNKHIQSEVTRLMGKLSKQNKARKEMYQKMMGNNNNKTPPASPSHGKKSLTSLYIGGTLVAIGAVLIGIYLSHR